MYNIHTYHSGIEYLIITQNQYLSACGIKQSYPSLYMADYVIDKASSIIHDPFFYPLFHMYIRIRRQTHKAFYYHQAISGGAMTTTTTHIVVLIIVVWFLF